MSNDLIFAARPAALEEAGIELSDVEREQNAFHPDGSVEFAFFSDSDGSVLLGHIMVDSEGNARAL